MDIRTKHIGRIQSGKCISIIIEVNGTKIEEDVVNLDGTIDKDLIESLREVANELEFHNDEIFKH